jgi:hypothetical protein
MKNYEAAIREVADKRRTRVFSRGSRCVLAGSLSQSILDTHVLDTVVNISRTDAKPR